MLPCQDHCQGAESNILGKSAAAASSQIHVPLKSMSGKVQMNCALKCAGDPTDCECKGKPCNFCLPILEVPAFTNQGPGEAEEGCVGGKPLSKPSAPISSSLCSG